MKHFFSRIKLRWKSCWSEDSEDEHQFHLSQSDKHDLLLGAFLN